MPDSEQIELGMNLYVVEPPPGSEAVRCVCAPSMEAALRAWRAGEAAKYSPPLDLAYVSEPVRIELMGAAIIAREGLKEDA